MSKQDSSKFDEIRKDFNARLTEVGIDPDELRAMEKTEKALRQGKQKQTKGLKADRLEFHKLLEAFREGKIIDPIFYPRDKGGKFTKRNLWTWKKGMKSPNPLGRPRPKTNLYARFCQVMELTEAELEALIKKKNLTLADEAAITLALNARKGSWPQQLEVINREEGKVQENVQIEAPPLPIRFVPVRERKTLEVD